VYAAVPNKISFSKMTFSHQMIRVFVVEQFYRAFTIINDLPYHHD
jgi:23S rRNA (pseudouridine1915-N3)-methyltransferase